MREMTMINERINIGTYPKDEVKNITDQIRKFAKERKQKVRISLKGRGKKDKGWSDGNVKGASHTAIYLEVFVDSSKERFLESDTRYTLQQKIKAMVKRSELDLDYLMNCGFKGFYTMSDNELVEYLIRNI